MTKSETLLEGRLFVPRQYEQIVTVVAAVMSIVVPVSTALAGASPQTVIGVGFLFFFILAGLLFFVLDKNPALSRLLVIMIFALMVLIVGVHFWPSWWSSADIKETSTAPITVKPPRLEIRAWFDKPTLESSPDGKVIRLNGNGERGWNENYITPIEVRAPSRVNSTLISRVPGYFTDYEPGETITAKVCGLDFDKKTYAQSDKRYTDQMIWTIPIPDSGTSICERVK